MLAMEGKDKNSNVWKDVVKIQMCIKIGPEFQCLDG